jgi:hypothetical protein
MRLLGAGPALPRLLSLALLGQLHRPLQLRRCDRQVAARRADVRVAEQVANVVQRHARFEPATRGFPARVVKSAILDAGASACRRVQVSALARQTGGGAAGDYRCRRKCRVLCDYLHPHDARGLRSNAARLLPDRTRTGPWRTRHDAANAGENVRSPKTANNNARAALSRGAVLQPTAFQATYLNSVILI